MCTLTLPLSLELLDWLEGWTPPHANEGAPLAIEEKIVIAVILAQIHDARRQKKIPANDNEP